LKDYILSCLYWICL